MPRVMLPFETQGRDHPSALTVNLEGRIDEATCEALRLLLFRRDWCGFDDDKERRGEDSERDAHPTDSESTQTSTRKQDPERVRSTHKCWGVTRWPHL